MRESRMSGSVGTAGEQSPAVTRQETEKPSIRQVSELDNLL